MGIKYIGNILYDKKLFESDSKIVIFGTGIYGRRVAEYLDQKCVKDHVICFCDANSDLENSEVMGIPVWSPFKVCKNYPDAEYLISGKYSREMYVCLKENYINKIHVLII